MKSLIGIIAGLLVLFFGIYFGMKFWRDDDATAENDNQVLCAQDTILCADGSYVGRVPPGCSFAACPSGTSTDPNDPDFQPSAS